MCYDPLSHTCIIELTVKVTTLILISGHGSASATEGKLEILLGILTEFQTVWKGYQTTLLQCSPLNGTLFFRDNI